MKRVNAKPVLLFHIGLVSLIAYTFFTPYPGQAHASVTSNENWNIQIEEINLDSVIPTISVNRQSPAVDAAEKKSNGTETGKPYSFSLSNSLIDYGILSPTNNVYRTTNIYLEKSQKGFIVLASEDKSLTLLNAETAIPDTTCDNGSCSQFTPALWENTLTYGFGYRCDNVIGSICPIDFRQINYYKQFSDISKQELPVAIMVNTTGNKNSEIQITYKLNISKSQTLGAYRNSITYMAVPGY